MVIEDCCIRIGVRTGNVVHFDVVLVDGALGASTSDERLAIRSAALNGEAQFFHQLPPDRVLGERERGLWTRLCECLDRTFRLA